MPLPSLVAHSNLTGLSLVTKSNPSGRSITFVLSLASDKEDMVCTLHLRPDTFASPNVISLFTVALEAVAPFPIIVLPEPVVVVDQCIGLILPSWIGGGGLQNHG